MENQNNNKGVITLLVVIIVILAVLCVLFATGTISLKSNTTNNNQQTSESNGSDNTESQEDDNLKSLNQDDFKKIVDDELYILFGFKSLNEVTNRRKLTLVFNKIDNNYNTIDTATKEQVEEAFNSTSIKNLGIQHESFDVFTYENNVYTKNKDIMSKRNLFNCGFANKVENFEKQGNKYIISVKYLFTDVCPVSGYYYGAYSNDDQKESNKIVEAYDSNNNYIDSQKYLDENYDNIKDKLDTYIYTFEVDSNNKINLVDFSVN